MVPKWVGNKPLIVAVTRIDQVTPQALKEWQHYFARPQTCGTAHAAQPTGDVKTHQASLIPVYFIDSKHGAGISALKTQALLAAAAVNERRQRLGMQPRAVRAAVIGFPNVGKSALINRILGKKKAISKDMPGVTRSMQWIRISGSLAEQTADGAIELLDSPGIIPASHIDQHKATHLAICNDIGDASYDRVVVAGIMCDKLIALHSQKPSFVDMARVEGRYGLPFRSLSGEEIVLQIADKYFHGNPTSAADRLLGDFRRGHYGHCSMEAPPTPTATQRGAAGDGGAVDAAVAVTGTRTTQHVKNNTHTNAGEADTQPGNPPAHATRGSMAGATRETVDAEAGSDRAGEKHFSFSFSAKEGKFDNW